MLSASMIIFGAINIGNGITALSTSDRIHTNPNPINPPIIHKKALSIRNSVRMVLLLAPNAFHHMGQAQWRKHFPNAVSYAPEDAIPRVSKKSGIDYQPISALQPRLGPHVQVIAPHGLKSTDLLVHASTPEGAIWFGGDLISTQAPGEGGLIFRAISRLAGGGPGYRYNPLASLLYLKDKQAWKADVRARMGRERLVAVVPAHGHVATGEVVARTQEILA